MCRVRRRWSHARSGPRARLIGRRFDGAFDLQVRLGGLEDLCADAVELDQRSDGLAVEALRLRRRTARSLTEAGIRTTDIAYLMGIPSGVGRAPAGRADRQPLDDQWPRATKPAAAVGPGQLAGNCSAADRDRGDWNGPGWHVRLDPGGQPAVRTSLVHAESLLRAWPVTPTSRAPGAHRPSGACGIAMGGTDRLANAEHRTRHSQIRRSRYVCCQPGRPFKLSVVPRYRSDQAF